MSKVVSLEEVPGLVPRGATISIGGAWFANHPMALVRQMVRAGREDVSAVALLGSVDVDLLIGAGVVRHVTFGMVTLEAFGLAPHLRRGVENGLIMIDEVSALGLEVALEAGGRNVPFLPYPGPYGSDLVDRHPEFYGTARSSFGDDVMVVKAMRTDVAFIHALRADAEGNAQFDGTFAMDPELAKAADLVVVTCEELVDTAEIARTANMTKIPGLLVDAVVPVPFGAHPTSHVPRYALDAWEVLEYARVAQAGGQVFSAYVDRLRNEDEEQYRDRVLGTDRAEVLATLNEGPALAVR